MTRPAHAGLGIAGLLLLALATPSAPPARAQGTAEQMGGMGWTQTFSDHATVKAVDMQTRAVTLAFDDGETMEFVAGPEVQNLAQVHPGDRVTARYHGSVAFVLAPPGSKLPADSLTMNATGAAPGQMPAGQANARMVVSFLVVGKDMATHTLQLVNPQGGAVRTVPVVTPEGQNAMGSIKPGDTITAVISKSLLLSVTPGA
jgi:Cu/Ag efflux protein CusF